MTAPPIAAASIASRMHRPPALALAMGAVACAGLAGCASSGPSASPEPTRSARVRPAAIGPAAYIVAVEEALRPPVELAQIASAHGRRDPPPPPPRADIESLVERSETALARIRAVRLTSAPLRRQRARLTARYEDVIVTMRALVEPLSRGRRLATRRAAFELFRSIRDLRFAVSSQPSP